MAESAFDKNLKKAEEAVRRQNPDYAIQICVSMLLKSEPDHEQANKVFFRAIREKWKGKKAPKPKKLALVKLYGLQKMGRWDGLAEACRNALPEDPANPKVFELLAESLINKDHYNAALETLRHLVTHVDSKNAIGWFWRAKCELQLGNAEDALNSCERARSIDGTNREIADFFKDVSAAHSLKSSGLDKAESLLDTVKDKDAAIKEAAKRKKQGKDSLLDQVEELGGLTSGDRKKLMEVARLYDQAGEYAKSAKAWKAVFEVDSHYVDALDNAGDMTFKYYRSQIEKARKKEDPREQEFREKLLKYSVQEYSRRVKNRPTDTGLQYDFGKALFDIGKFKEAAGALQKASKDPKKASEAALMLGRSFLEIEQHELAENQLKKAEESMITDERRLEAKYWRGHALLKQERPADAKKLFMEILMEDVGYLDVDDIVKGL